MTQTFTHRIVVYIACRWGTIMTSESLQPILNVFAYPDLNWPTGWTAAGLVAVNVRSIVLLVVVLHSVL